MPAVLNASFILLGFIISARCIH